VKSIHLHPEPQGAGGATDIQAAITHDGRYPRHRCGFNNSVRAALFQIFTKLSYQNFFGEDTLGFTTDYTGRAHRKQFPDLSQFRIKPNAFIAYAAAARIEQASQFSLRLRSGRC
jgi:hypothetical protein